MPLRKLLSLFKRKKKTPAQPVQHHAAAPARHQAEPHRKPVAATAAHAPVRNQNHQTARPARPQGAPAQGQRSQPHQPNRPPQTPRPASKPGGTIAQPGRQHPQHQTTRPMTQHPPRPVQHVPVRPQHVPPVQVPLPRAPKAVSTEPTLRFDQLGLNPNLLEALKTEGYTEPTPIQQQAIPVALAGKDILGCAQTGTGKTAAFALPILQRLDRPEITKEQYRTIRALIVTPTRELAAQVGQSFAAYGRNINLRSAVVYGGVYQGTQAKAMRGGVDILVATPGRLLDLMDQKMVLLHKVEILVLDEADRMLDMGFINDIKKIVAKVPSRRQTLFFSATMPPEIRTLAGGILDQPVSISIMAEFAAADTVEQSVYFVEKDDKPDLLRHLLSQKGMERTLVFTRTKVRADRLSRRLTTWGIPAQAIHGDKSQNTRERVLSGFKAGSIRVLVASDVVSRGIDIDNISHVVNFDLPHEAEAYVHRIGRTGRAGALGTAISFCDSEERQDLAQVERLLGRSIPVATGHPYQSTAPVRTHTAPARNSRGSGSKPYRRR